MYLHSTINQPKTVPFMLSMEGNCYCSRKLRFNEIRLLYPAWPVAPWMRTDDSEFMLTDFWHRSAVYFKLDWMSVAVGVGRMTDQR